MKLRIVLAATALAAAVSGACASHAAILTASYTQDGVTGGAGGSAPYGTVKVDDAGGVLAFTIDLSDDLVFRNAPDPNHWSFGFDLDVSGATIGSISDNGTGSFDAIPGSHNFSPFGTFDYVVDCDSGCSTSFNANSPTELKFTVTGSGTLTLGDIVANSDHELFATDIASGNNGNTGNIGANIGVTSTTFTTSVPEPVTWAMILMGFGSLGALLRGQRRRRLEAIA